MIMITITIALMSTAVMMPANGDVTGTSPRNGACLCLNGDRVNIRSSACGSVIGSANTGQCYAYSGSKSRCTLSGRSYEFFKINFGGRQGWSAGTYLNLGADSRCSTGGGTPAGNEYTCAITDMGKRIQETLSSTPYDCKDSNCANTCRGGQCVAYVTCKCKRNGRWAPRTSCWRPGQRLRTSDGKCNRNIAPNTAIATFDSNGRYYYSGHAAVFVRCRDDYTVEVYDQWCGRSAGYSTYSSSHRFYPNFATITSPGCSDRDSWPCRVENSGPNQCPASQPRC